MRRDQKEFKKMCDHMVKGKYDLKRLNFSYESLDKDKDGKITYNEVSLTEREMETRGAKSICESIN